MLKYKDGTSITCESKQIPRYKGVLQIMQELKDKIKQLEQALSKKANQLNDMDIILNSYKIKLHNKDNEIASLKREITLRGRKIKRYEKS